GGLFRIDVLARLHGQDGGHRMPAISGGDEQSIDVLARGQELAEIAIHGAVLVGVMLIDKMLDELSALLLDIANGDELDILFLEHPAEVKLAARSDADTAQHDARVSGCAAVQTERLGPDKKRRCDHRASGCRCALEELS